MMRLADLLAPWREVATSDADVEVTGVGHDSRRIAPGDLYVAIAGARFDGRQFAADAVARGAVAVLGPAPDGATAVDVPWIAEDDPRAILGPLAARLYEHPDRALGVVGVTGTNGKSTTVDVLADLLDAAGRPAGRLGTLGYRFGAHEFRDAFVDGRTTPEAPDLYRTLAAMRSRGARAAVMEVSSHALDQGRVAGARFEVAIFTNLTRDHLDYHGDMASYFAAKCRLFDQLGPTGRGVVNIDDPYGRQLAAARPEALTYSAGGATQADVHTLDAILDLEGIRGRLATPRGPLAFETGLLGRYNLENVIASVAAAEVLGLEHESIARGLAARRPVEGRLEPINGQAPFPVLVDYAHTPGALEAAINALRELVAPTGRRVLVVFGCGGDRDRGKRGPMGQVVGSLADHAVATSDNPRGEDPQAILAAIEVGLRDGGMATYEVVADRRQAIATAIRRALGAPDRWAVLVAGKGHEAVQVIGKSTLPFSDHDEVRRVLAAAGGPDATDGVGGWEGARHG